MLTRYSREIAGGLLAIALPAAAFAADDAARKSDPAFFQPPAEETLSRDAFGALVKKGEDIFVNTGAAAPGFVGNDLACVNCHIDRGRLADSAPLWAAYPVYPAFRKKNNKVNTFAERLRGCFQYSMNGKPPPIDSEIIAALTTYAFWLATGAPVGKSLPGRGFNQPPPPRGGYNIPHGEKIYGEQCAICHGPTGDGQKVGATVVFPPLWGRNSFNWGAGMHRIDTAAGFIQHNMPLGRGDTLSNQDAWDVAAFVDSHERPQDPRLVDGDIEKTRVKYHEGDGVNLYGQKVNGVLLGQGAK
jgi:thiosulfate dehydrogenase